MQSTTSANMISSHLVVRPDWLGQRREPALEPELPIVDPHHFRFSRFFDEPFLDLAGFIAAQFIRIFNRIPGILSMLNKNMVV